MAPLHGIRGIAVLYVVISHLGNAGLFLVPISHNAIGKVGVWMFFGLSAFLLTSRLYRELQGAASKRFVLVRYTIHRVFRIFPLYVTVLGLYLLIGDMSVGEVGRHLALVAGRNELWAIPVEFKYYFVVPCVVLIGVVMPIRYWSWCLIGVVVAITTYSAGRPDTVFSNGLALIPKLAPFLFGSVLAFAMISETYKPQHKPSRLSLGIGLLCVLALIAETIAYRGIYKGTVPLDAAPWLSAVIGISIMGLMYAGLQSNYLSRVLRATPLVFLGEISFSVYLLHVMVLQLVIGINGVSPVLKGWLALGASVVAASVTYWVIERPGIRSGRTISDKVFRTLFARSDRDRDRADTVGERGKENA